MSAVAPLGGALTRRLPVGPHGREALGWYGLLTLIGSEAALFAYLLFSFYYTVTQQAGELGPTQPPSLALAGPNTLVLLASSAVAWYGERALRRGRRALATGAFVLTAALGVTFTLVQLREWSMKPFSLSSDLYGSLYFTITGFHLAHVAVGLIALLLLAIWLGGGYLDERRDAPVPIITTYWHFVDAVWLAVFTTFYLLPHVR